MLEPLEIVGDLPGRKPRQMSGGQRQRVAVARALVHNPLVVFADEPTASLNPNTSALTLKMIDEALGRTGAALLMVTHNFEDALALCRRFILLRNGRIVADLEDPERNLTAGDLVTLLAAETEASPPTMAASPPIKPFPSRPGPALAERPTVPPERNWRSAPARTAWRASGVVRDSIDGRTRGFAIACLLIAAVNSFALTLLWGLREGTVVALTAAVTADPAYRRIEVHPEGVPILTAGQVEALQKIEGTRVELFQLMALRVPGAAQLPRFMVLGPNDPLWDLIDPGGVIRAGGLFGIILSDKQAVRFRLMNAPLSPGSGPVPWAKLAGERALLVQCGDELVPVPVLAVIPDTDLGPKIRGRDGVLTRKTAWMLENWKAEWIYTVTRPDAFALRPRTSLVSSQTIEIAGESSVDLTRLLESPAVAQLEETVAAQGWIPLFDLKPETGGTTTLTVRWARTNGAGERLAASLDPVEHNAFITDLTTTLRSAGVRVVRLGEPAVAPLQPLEVRLPPGVDDNQAGQGSVYVDDFWRIPEVLIHKPADAVRFVERGDPPTHPGDSSPP
jgi:hypothetical protein